MKLREAFSSALTSGLPAKDPIWKTVSEALEALPKSSPPPLEEGENGDDNLISGGGILSNAEITKEIELVREDLVRVLIS